MIMRKTVDLSNATESEGVEMQNDGVVGAAEVN